MVQRRFKDVGAPQLATSNRGMLSPSVQAPGEFWFGGLPYCGSSFAAPVVSGVLANWMACQPGVPFLPLPPGVVQAYRQRPPIKTPLFHSGRGAFSRSGVRR